MRLLGYCCYLEFLWTTIKKDKNISVSKRLRTTNYYFTCRANSPNCNRCNTRVPVSRCQQIAITNGTVAFHPDIPWEWIWAGIWWRRTFKQCHMMYNRIFSAANVDKKLWMLLVDSVIGSCSLSYVTFSLSSAMLRSRLCDVYLVELGRVIFYTSKGCPYSIR